MKRRISAICMTLALLAGCAPGAKPVETVPEQEETGSLTAREGARTILAGQKDGEDYSEVTGEEKTIRMEELYGLSREEWTEAAVYTAAGTDPREVAVIRVGPDGRAGEKLEQYRMDRWADFNGYLPGEAALVEQGGVYTGGEWAVLALCSQPEAARSAFLTWAGGESTEPVTPEPTPAEPVIPKPTPGGNGWVPFDPPNEYDMSLWDDTGVVRAWETGEEGGLSGEEAAVLAACREIFGQVITDGMTDFEKELALHDWLVDNGEYDESCHDPDTPQGRPGNTTPYGMLVEGYGICLGYAETFRLFMDLAGIPCVTVVGAATDSREDHAWNMVMLEGEWYCVDVTWDDPIMKDKAGRRVEVRVEKYPSVTHRYFNVPSEYMRVKDHQWAYEEVPEATATRFRWDGAGEKPV